MSIKNMDDLREFLSNEMQKVADGDSTPASANACANLGGKLLSTFKVELQYSSISGKTPDIGFLNKE